MKIKLDLLKKKKVFKKEGVFIKPNLYWKFIISISFIIIFASFAFGFYLFNFISSDPNVATESARSYADKIKEKRIKKVLQYFAEREAKSLEIITSPAPVSDPSVYGSPQGTVAPPTTPALNKNSPKVNN